MNKELEKNTAHNIAVYMVTIVIGWSMGCLIGYIVEIMK